MAIEFLTNYEWVEIDRPNDIEFFIATNTRMPERGLAIHVRRVVAV